MTKYTTSFFYLCLFCLFTSVITAQSKKYLSPDEYGKWQSLGATAIAPNGEWVAYQITVQEDNDTLFVINKQTQTSYKLEFASSPDFSKDNQWLAYRIGLPFKEAEKLREQTKPIEYKMGLLNLVTGKKNQFKTLAVLVFHVMVNS
jgi:hypothetical protein